tara:strand:+ start:1059 stop:3215 length:2157 start_codon:yes stop_codon:yes gene_type:complete
MKRQVTVTEKYNAVLEGNMAQGEFVRQMRLKFPQLLTNLNVYEDTVQILKNNNLISEGVDTQIGAVVSDESIRRALDIELTVLGEDPVTCKDGDMIDKARIKALANIKKDPLHYYNLIAGESSKVDKNDQSKETKRGAGDIDVHNGLKKATLKEGHPAHADGTPKSNDEMTDDERENFYNDLDSVDEKMSDAEMDAVKNYEPGSDTSDVPTVYKPGDMFSTDFDYEGMLKAGLKIRLNTPEETMQAIFDSFEDVNYHREGEHLSYVIDAKIEGDKEEALKYLKSFRKAIQQTLSELFEGVFPIREREEDYVSRADRKIAEIQIEDIDEADPIPTEPGQTKIGDDGEEYGVRASNHDRKMAMRKVIDFLTITGHPSTGHKVSNDEALSFIRTHNEDIFSGDIDAFNIDDVWDNYDQFEAVNRPSESTIDENKRKKTKGGKMVQEADYDTGGYVESMGPKFDKACDTLSRAFGEWADGPMTEPGMIEPAKRDVVQYIDQKLTEQFLEEAEALDTTAAYKSDDDTQDMIDKMKKDGKDADDFVDEKKGTDHDKDGDIDGDDYMAAKDKAIKKALKENVKAIISKILTETTINEAATAKLSDWGAGYESFEGVKPVVNELENIVTELESFYDRMNDKISKAFEKTNNFKNDEGLNIGAFIAPSLEAAFLQDLRPIRKNFLKGGIALPKVKTISSAEINQMKADGLAEEPKSNIFQPVTAVKR